MMDNGDPQNFLVEKRIAEFMNDKNEIYILRALAK